MGWSWAHQADLMLQAYPTLANIPELVERWPALQQAVAQLRASGGSPGRQPPQANQEPQQRSRQR